MTLQGTIFTGTRACAKSAMDGWFTQFSVIEEFEAKSNQLLAEMPVLPNEWKISLKLKPTSFGPGEDNVIFLTNGLSKFKGFSALRIYLIRHFGLKVISGVNKPYFINYFGEFNGKLAKKLQKGEEWVDIQISQEFAYSFSKWVCGPWASNCRRNETKTLMFRVFIDGVEELSVENETPQFFENVKLYTGYGVSPFNGWIKELSIKIKEDDLIKFRLTKIKEHYSKEPPSGEFYLLGPRNV